MGRGGELKEGVEGRGGRGLSLIDFDQVLFVIGMSLMDELMEK